MAALNEKREARPSLVLGIIVTGYLMFAVDTSIVNVALPTLRDGLRFSTIGLSWVVNAYMLVYGGLLFLGGRSGDLIGRRTSLLIGVAIFTAASALGGMASSGAWLIISRALQGVGAAFAAPSTMALLITNFPEGPGRNRALSTYSAAASLGAIIGLMLGGILTAFVSWRWVFFVNVPFGLAVLLLAPRILTETGRRDGAFDLSGAASSTLGVSALVMGLIRTASHGWSDAPTVASLAAGVALLTFFIVHERRVKEPLLPLHLFADRNRVAAYLSLLLIVAGNYGAFFFATQFLQGVLHFGALQSGLAFVPLALALMITVRIVPRLLKRVSPRALLIPATLLQAGALAWISRLSPSSTYVAGILGPVVMLGLAMGLSIMPLNVVALTRVESAEAGAASGLAQTMMMVGGAIGLSVLITVFGGAAHGAAAAPESFLRGARTALTAAGAFAVGAFLVVLLVMRGPGRAPRLRRVNPEANKGVVRRYFEMWNTGNVDRVHEILHPNWVDHANAEIRGARDVAATLLQTRADSPDFHIGVETMVSEGDRVAVHSTVRRTVEGVPSVSRVMWLVRIEDDRMAEMWTANEEAS